MSDTKIPTPGALLRRYGLSPRKSWGQNFLHAVEIHHNIVRASGAAPGKRVVEIGAGLGTLTMHLLATGAEVWAIERDRDLCHVLREELGGHEHFRLFEADAVRWDYAQASADLDPGSPPPSVVGNLPYQITGALLFALLDHHATTGSWIVMVQKEVADRLCAPPGSRTYGAATVSLSRLRAITKVCAVPSGCFLPPPRVESAVIRLAPRETPRGEVPDEARFRELVRAAFSRRRKQLANSLSGLASRDEVLSWCEAAQVQPTVRPEQLAPEQFAALARARDEGGGVGAAEAPGFASEPGDA